VQYLATPGVEYRSDNVKVSSFGEPLGPGGWVFDPAATVALEDAKLRFIDEHEASLADPARLRRAVARCAGVEVLHFAGHAANQSRAEGLRALGQVMRIRPRTALTPAIAKVVAKTVLGPRLSARVSRRVEPVRP
jgi:hypothetical protein